MRQLICAIVLAVLSALAGAAEIVVFCPGAVQTIVTGLGKDFTQATGHTIKFAHGTAGSVAKRVADGEDGDIVISTAQLLADLAKSGQVAGEGIRNLGSMGVGVAVRAGAARPDVTTVAAFKAAMLAARTITYADPAHGGQSGIHVAKVFEQLGIARELEPKLLLRPGAPQAFIEVARGDIEIGLGQISEILANKGLMLVGPLPREIQNSATFSVALHGRAKANDAARALVEFLTSPNAIERFKAAGFEVN
jgi:molybdate transport system substrate-binding protein